MHAAIHILLTTMQLKSRLNDHRIGRFSSLIRALAKPGERNLSTLAFNSARRSNTKAGPYLHCVRTRFGFTALNMWITRLHHQHHQGAVR